jgi:hypothetical protein
MNPLKIRSQMHPKLFCLAVLVGLATNSNNQVEIREGLYQTKSINFPKE